jgi:predicted AAA+ superfamily ATPase
MRPLSLVERGIAVPTVRLSGLLDGSVPAVAGESNVTLEAYVEEIFASGFPGIRPLGHRAREARLQGYVSHLVEKEFKELGVAVRRPETLLSWLRAYAAATATTATYEAVLDAATPGLATKPARSTMLVYRDVLARAFLLDSLPAWSPAFTPLATLSKAPKHFLADPALAAHLLRVRKGDALAGRDRAGWGRRSALGALFEHLVAQSVLAYVTDPLTVVAHMRLPHGEREVDIVVDDGVRALAIEVKLHAELTPRDVRHLLWLKGQLGDRLADMLVVTAGRFAYRRDDGIAVVPAALLGP